MKEQLRELLFEFLTRQAPEVIINNGAKSKLDSLLSETVEQVEGIGERLISKGIAGDKVVLICLELITRQYKPSKYHYIAAILQQLQPSPYMLWREKGILTLQVSKLIVLCEPAFKDHGFRPATANDQNLRLVISSIVQTYASSTACT